jgi:hypothetical protein
LQLAGNPVIVFGSKGYAGTRNQWRAAYPR